MKNISYDKYTDLENCAEEPIQTLGRIQDFGYLAVFEENSQRLKFISENLYNVLDFKKKDNSIIDLKNFLNIFNLNQDSFEIKSKTKRVKSTFLDFKSESYLAKLRNQDNLIYLEFEPVGNTFSTEDYINQTDNLIQLINNASDFYGFAQLIADNIQQITDYDRVMVYRFDSDFNGEVIAEKLNINKPSFLGLNYPHTDIPKQARELYKKDKCRIVVDVNSNSSPVLSLEKNASYKDLDLTGSIFRASSPIHLQYLKNMGVCSTLTISVIIGEQLWGLIACHHYEKKYIGQSERVAAILQTDFFASQIKRWERSDEYNLVQEKEHIYQAIVEEGVKHKDLFKAIINQTYILGLTSSKGGAIIRNNKIHTFGNSLNESEIIRLHNFMKKRKEHIFLTNTLGEYFNEAKKYPEIASGILYYRLDLDSNNAIMWFRPQQSEGRKWGGDPTEALKGKREVLTPRNSFEAWEENVSGKSKIWRSHEIQAGLRVCAFLEREIYINSLKEQKRIFEQLTSELKEKNQELSQFNWISSHDMKEPLRKIRLFVDQIKSEEDKLTTNHQMFFGRIDSAANYMQNLINDLLNYASLNQKETFEKINLKEILDETIQDLQTDELINIKVPDNIEFKGIAFQIKQLFANIISNSIKFKHPDRKLKINITSDIIDDAADSENNKLEIKFQDNGIGFESKYEQKIFQVFQRLHTKQEYPGTGIGLAICKKVMEKHKGVIKAYGKECHGATFKVYFPI